MKGPSHLLYSLYERRLVRRLDADRFPHHIGIVLDGHRRYARESGLVLVHRELPGGHGSLRRLPRVDRRARHAGHHRLGPVP